MLFAKNSDLEWVYSDKHDMDAGFNNNLPTNLSADVMFARIKSGHTLTMHYHTRPYDFDGQDNGYESFFFFQGGKILLFRKDETIKYELNEPFTLTFFSHEEDMHGIKNIDNKDVIFQVLCAPKFNESEEHFVEI